MADFYRDNLFEVVNVLPIDCSLIMGIFNEQDEWGKENIRRIRKEIKESRLLSYCFAKHQYHCGNCGGQLHKNESYHFCPHCGSYNSDLPSSDLKYIEYINISDLETILANAAIKMENPQAFIRCLEVIENETNSKKRYFELNKTILIEGNKTPLHSYRCGACDEKLYDNELIGKVLKFCPKCGIPFRRTRLIRQENGEETTTFI